MPIRSPRPRRSAASPARHRTGLVESLENRRLLAAALVDFEGLGGDQAGSGGVYDAPSGYRFENQRSSGSLDAAGPRLFGPSRGFASNVIQPANWGERIVITRPDGQPFTLSSFDFGASVYGNSGDFTVTTVSGGVTSAPQATSFTGQRSPLQTLTLNRQNLTRVVIEFDGGVNAVGGSLDNFRLETSGTVGPGPASVSGSLANPNPVAGPLTVRYDQNGWQVGHEIVPLPDGRFYSFGWGSSDNAPYALRHLPDGSLDTSFGVGGRIETRGPLASLSYGDGRVFSVPTGGFAVVTAPDFKPVLTRYDADLKPVTSFGNFGQVASPGQVAGFRSDGGFVTLTFDHQTWRVYNGAGQLVSTKPAQGLLDNRDPDGRFYEYFGGLEMDASGAVYALLGSGTASGIDGYTGVRKFDPDLSPANGYAGDGVADEDRLPGWDGEIDEFESFLVAADGRVAVLDRVDPQSTGGTLDVTLFAPNGSPAFRDAIVFDGRATSQNASVDDAFFHADGDLSLASFVSRASNSSNPAGVPRGFAVTRLNASGTLDGASGRVTVLSGQNGVAGNFRPFSARALPDGDYVLGGSGGTSALGTALPQLYKVDTGPGDNNGGGGTGGGTSRPAFGTNGLRTISSPDFDYEVVKESVPAPDGGVFLIGEIGNVAADDDSFPTGGQAPAPANPETFVAKLRADGSFDPAFTDNGITNAARLSWPGPLTGFDPLPGGGYVGTFGSNDSRIQAGTRLVKLNAGFALDRSFGGGDGIADLADFSVYDVRPDGRIVVAGMPFGGEAAYLQLLNADGSPAGGKVPIWSRLTASGYTASTAFDIGDVTAGPDNSVYLSLRRTTSAGQRIEVARFTGDELTTPSNGFGVVRFAQFGAGDIVLPREVYVGPTGRGVQVVGEDDGVTRLIPFGPGIAAGAGNGFVPKLDTAAVPYLNTLDNAPRVLDVGFTADGGFTVATRYQTAVAAPYGFEFEDGVASAFALAKFKADATPDTAFGTNGRQGLFNAERPIVVNDADYVGDGAFFLAGGDDGGSIVSGGSVADFDLNASVRLVDVDGDTGGGGGGGGGTGTRTNVTVDFQAAPIGATPAAGYADSSGFTFVSVDGGGSLTSTNTTPLRVYGPERGYPSKVLHPDNWGRAIVVRRPDGKAFDLAAFKYAASVFRDSGDFTVVASFADGTTRQITRQAFGSSRTPTRLELNLTNLRQVAVNFADGVNPAYGAVDDFELSFAGSGTGGGGGGTTAKGVVVEAENAASGVSNAQVGAWATVAGGVGASVQATPDTGRNLGDFAQYAANGPRLKYGVTLPAAGRYYLWVRGRGVAGDVGSSDSMHFGLNGGRVASAEALVVPTEQLAWSNARFRTSERAYIDVASAGPATINLYMREDGTVLDRFLLTSDPNYVPTGSGPAAGTLA